LAVNILKAETGSQGLGAGMMRGLELGSKFLPAPSLQPLIPAFNFTALKANDLMLPSDLQ
jgi:hypothetical protein